MLVVLYFGPKEYCGSASNVRRFFGISWHEMEVIAPERLESVVEMVFEYTTSAEETTLAYEYSSMVADDSIVFTKVH